MTSHTPTSKRLNFGPPGVCVRSWATLSGKTNLKPWHAKRYRRAVMQGAGVYLLGLWHFLTKAPKKALKHTEKPFTVSFNLCALWYFSDLPCLEPDNVSKNFYNRTVKPKRSKKSIRRGLNPLMRRKTRAGKSKRATPHCYLSQLIEKHNKLARDMYNSSFGIFWISANSKVRLGKSHKIIRALTSKLRLSREYVTLYARLIASLIKRADHYRAFLSRIVKTRKRPARIPRPIHTRPRPPAAPLAPPIFA